MWFLRSCCTLNSHDLFFHSFLESEEGTILFWNDLLLSAEDSKVYEQMNEYRFLSLFFSTRNENKIISVVLLLRYLPIQCCVCAHSMCDPSRPSLGGVHQTKHIILALLHKRWQTNRRDETRGDVWCGSGTGWVGELGVVVRTMKYKLANMHYLLRPYKKCGSVKQI
jgi:hypothetical protein